MEIGCGTGFFLEKARDLGVQTLVGFEPSKDCFQRAAESIRPLIVNDVYPTGNGPWSGV